MAGEGCFGGLASAGAASSALPGELKDATSSTLRGEVAVRAWSAQGPAPFSQLLDVEVCGSSSTATLRRFEGESSDFKPPKADQMRLIYCRAYERYL